MNSKSEIGVLDIPVFTSDGDFPADKRLDVSVRFLNEESAVRADAKGCEGTFPVFCRICIGIGILSARFSGRIHGRGGFVHTGRRTVEIDRSVSMNQEIVVFLQEKAEVACPAVFPKKMEHLRYKGQNNGLPVGRCIDAGHERYNSGKSGSRGLG